MAKASFCDPCTKANYQCQQQSIAPTVKSCAACVESHARFKAFTSHHVIDLSSIDLNIPVSAKNICNVHPDMLLDYYCTDRAVVTLKDEESIQFVNTTTTTKADIINVGFRCYGITAVHDRIYVGGANGIIKTIDTNGTILKTIQLRVGAIYFISYDDDQKQFFVRGHNKLQCIKLDGTLAYSKDVPDTAGVTRDKQGNIYYGGINNSNIQRISPDGENCKEMLKKRQWYKSTLWNVF